MGINYVESDILTSPASTLVCPVNTVGVMGAGLAKQFSIVYPKLVSLYARACHRGDLQIGQLWTWHSRAKSILCFPTKSHWRHPSRIEYIVSGLRMFRHRYRDYLHTPYISDPHIAFPCLGCGLGGLSWDIVKPEMEFYLNDLPIRVDVHVLSSATKVIVDARNSATGHTS